MAIMDKILFWRHKEPEPSLEAPPMGLGKESDLGLDQPIPGEEPVGAGIAPSGLPPLENQPPVSPGPAPNAPPGVGMAPPPSMPPVGKDIEIISAKIDALKATLDSINQRLENLERLAKQGNEDVY